jgi:hypothetical protein
VVAADEKVRCGVIRCTGMKVRYEQVTCTVKPCAGKVEKILHSFVRNRDGSGERPLTYGAAPPDPTLKRFFKQILRGPKGENVVALYDVETGKMADLGKNRMRMGAQAFRDLRVGRILTWRVPR